jgi:hypothetical protein
MMNFLVIYTRNARSRNDSMKPGHGVSGGFLKTE